MNIIIVYILFLLALLILKKPGQLSFFLYLIYLISAISGLLLMILDDEMIYFYNTNYENLFVLLVLIFPWIESFSGVSIPKNGINSLSLCEFNKTVNVLIAIFLVVSLYLFYTSLNILTTVDLTTYRSDKNYGMYITGGKIFTISAMISYLSFVPHFFFFMSYIYPISKIKRWLLFFCSLSFVFTTLCYAGRDGLLYWIMNSFVFFFMLKDSFPEKERKRLFSYITFIFALISIIFLTISSFRFLSGALSEANISELFIPLLDYIGQQVHIFCQGFEYRNMNLSDDHYLTYTFGTFIYSFIRQYGLIAAIIITFCCYTIIKAFKRAYCRQQNLWLFLAIYSIFLIPWYGVFYYRQSHQYCDLMTFVFLIICVYLCNMRHLRFYK